MKNNPRITKKERGLLKGAVRRVFSRSDLRKSVLEAAKIEHSDPTRPRVKTWYRCQECKGAFAGYQMQVDHKEPLIPLDSSLDEMGFDQLLNRAWCEKDKLQLFCLLCHESKTKIENKLRRQNKKEKKKQ